MVFSLNPGLPSGKHTKSDIENGPVEIVSFPINSMVIFPSVFWDCLPGRVVNHQRSTGTQLPY